MSATRSDSRIQALGWRGIGVTADIITRRDSYKDGFVAVANDGDDGSPAISLWWPKTGTCQREAAFWMSPEDARKLALALLVRAMEAEDRD